MSNITSSKSCSVPERRTTVNRNPVHRNRNEWWCPTQHLNLHSVAALGGTQLYFAFGHCQNLQKNAIVYPDISTCIVDIADENEWIPAVMIGLFISVRALLQFDCCSSVDVCYHGPSHASIAAKNQFSARSPSEELMTSGRVVWITTVKDHRNCAATRTRAAFAGG